METFGLKDIIIDRRLMLSSNQYRFRFWFLWNVRKVWERLRNSGLIYRVHSHCTTTQCVFINRKFSIISRKQRDIFFFICTLNGSCLVMHFIIVYKTDLMIGLSYLTQHPVDFYRSACTCTFFSWTMKANSYIRKKIFHKNVF